MNRKLVLINIINNVTSQKFSSGWLCETWNMIQIKFYNSPAYHFDFWGKPTALDILNKKVYEDYLNESQI
jgi:hypothetical protein